ncbi:hypothetical protein [Myroides fluvii]|uniref:hypothetical protein n=1 Tax=Myroides fluvii TaxID=2572594 RepID=UPI00131D8D49|nr:hypothetical protein [Myroides fluvii]
MNLQYFEYFHQNGKRKILSEIQCVVFSQVKKINLFYFEYFNQNGKRKILSEIQRIEIYKAKKDDPPLF